MNSASDDYWMFPQTYLLPHWRSLALLLALLVLGIGLDLLNPLLGHFIDTAVAHGSLRALTAIALVFLGVVLLAQLIALADTYLAEGVAWEATNALRGDVAAHCLHLDLPFHHAHTPGALIERIDGDAGLLANFLSRFVVTVLGNGLFLIGLLIVLMHIDWRIGLPLLGYGLVALLVFRRIRGLAQPYQHAARQASADLYGFLEERLSGIEDIRASGATAYQLRRLSELLRRTLRTERWANLMGQVLWGAAVLLVTFGTALALVLCAVLYQRNAMSIGTVYLVFRYTQQLVGSLQTISEHLADFQQAAVGMARLLELLALRPAIVYGAGVPVPSGPLAVAFEDVSFAYQAGDLVLRDLTFSIPAGSILGLLGRTGSGKTTIARLLFRFYDPTAGLIRLGGVDLRQARLDEVRGRVALVTQEVQLFHASVRDNLTFFDHDLPDARILAAFAQLGLLEWYGALPAGLDTTLDAGSLSAGEAQLLALTRVLLADPSVLILDEASARLDPATEALLERALDRLLAGRTALIIAHRLGTVARADQILILEDGRIREHGPREALAADPDSAFARLLRREVSEAPA